MKRSEKALSSEKYSNHIKICDSLMVVQGDDRSFTRNCVDVYYLCFSSLFQASADYCEEKLKGMLRALKDYSNAKIVEIATYVIQFPDPATRYCNQIIQSFDIIHSV